MSCFICSDRHIATIAVAYGHNPQAVADQLLASNVASVNYRYDENTAAGTVDLSQAVTGFYQPHDLVALCGCLDYQSCDVDDYQNPLLDEITAAFKAQCRHGIKSNIWSI